MLVSQAAVFGVGHPLAYAHLSGPEQGVPALGRLTGHVGPQGVSSRFQYLPSHHAVFMPPHPFGYGHFTDALQVVPGLGWVVGHPAAQGSVATFQ